MTLEELDRLREILSAFRAGYAWGYVHADNGSDDKPGEAFTTWIETGTVPS